ncbi:MAG: hypothetical protein R3B45_07200 [Bdellovibrionota bacterium]
MMGTAFKLKNGSILLSTEAPGGIYNSEQLKEIAALCDQELALVKVTEDQRLALFVSEDRAGEISQKLELSGLGIRNYRQGLHQPTSCVGELCPEHKQDAQGAAMSMTSEIGDIQINNPLRIGINGCATCCVPCHTLDISIVGDDSGYRISIGGKNTQLPEMATFLAEGVPAEELSGLVRTIIELYRDNAEGEETLQDLLERKGTAEFVEALSPYSQDAAADGDPFAALDGNSDDITDEDSDINLEDEQQEIQALEDNDDIEEDGDGDQLLLDEIDSDDVLDIADNENEESDQILVSDEIENCQQLDDLNPNEKGNELSAEMDINPQQFSGGEDMSNEVPINGSGSELEEQSLLSTEDVELDEIDDEQDVIEEDEENLDLSTEVDSQDEESIDIESESTTYDEDDFSDADLSEDVIAEGSENFEQLEEIENTGDNVINDELSLDADTEEPLEISTEEDEVAFESKFNEDIEDTQRISEPDMGIESERSEAIRLVEDSDELEEEFDETLDTDEEEVALNQELGFETDDVDDDDEEYSSDMDQISGTLVGINFVDSEFVLEFSSGIEIHLDSQLIHKFGERRFIVGGQTVCAHADGKTLSIEVDGVRFVLPMLKAS